MENRGIFIDVRFAGFTGVTTDELASGEESADREMVNVGEIVDGGGWLVGLLLEWAGLEGFLAFGDFGMEVGLERSPEIVAEPGGEG